MINNKELANIIFPDVATTIDDLEKKFPKRMLPEGAEVTRFAPSPTGFLHTGSLFTSMICRKVATQSGGVFYVRLEDTDTKREIEGSGQELLEQLSLFNVTPDEGYLGNKQKGAYGPYIQSERADIYRVVIKYLLEMGKAYPCFCTPEELNEIRTKQEAAKLVPGYYGQFAKCRFLTNDERATRLLAGEPFVIRFKSSGNHIRKIRVSDLIRGTFEIAQNDQDIVIYKSDGLPTYHFAHVVDDHFMRTTTVIRGEEWIASLPIHIELFEALGWPAPLYAHLPVIMKLDENGNKRKLSKRLDSEAAVSYFLKDGYPTEALIMYLMTIANSNFEEWIFQHKFEHMEEFTFSFGKMSLDGALFDIGKLNFFAREILAKKNKDEIYDMVVDYASKYQPKLLEVVNRSPAYFKEIMNIEREKENPRKDYEKFGDLLNSIGFFYDDFYDAILKEALPFNEKLSSSLISKVLVAIKDDLSLDQDEQSWFSQMKQIGESLGFAPNGKLFKNNPGLYVGSVADVAEILRITLTGKKNSPNLYYVMKVLNKGRCDARIKRVISSF
ncbi:MAG TPA: glutamate--tRNA ligase [Bacilli bacterium]|nr:glutamate--tRNA ligase [Bacilli bacterium]HPS19162.1 glutamate--tRNA ligase [Bacilli bacterium]